MRGRLANVGGTMNLGPGKFVRFDPQDLLEIQEYGKRTGKANDSATIRHLTIAGLEYERLKEHKIMEIT